MRYNNTILVFRYRVAPIYWINFLRHGSNRYAFYRDQSSGHVRRSRPRLARAHGTELDVDRGRVISRARCRFGSGLFAALGMATDRTADQLERRIVRECNREHGTKFKLADLMEWSSAPIDPRDDEVQYKLSYGLHLAFKKPKVCGNCGRPATVSIGEDINRCDRCKDL